MRFDRPEIWALAAVFMIAGLVLTFGNIAEEVLEGDVTKFDQTILLFFRNATDISDPIGPPWMEEIAKMVSTQHRQRWNRIKDTGGNLSKKLCLINWMQRRGSLCLVID